jgi:hypothetical protein
VSIDQGIIVLYSTFNGSTTDFLHMNDSQLAVIQSMTLERTIYGKIVLSQATNLTRDAQNNIVDLDSNVEILYNSISIDTSELTSLNNSATVYLYNLPFNYPRILKNGQVCPVGTCTKISYSDTDGTLVFSVAGFDNAVYSAEETPLNQITPPSGGGGGSLKGIPPPPGSVSVSVIIQDFEILNNSIRVLLYPGENITETIEIKNTGNNILGLRLDGGLLSKYITFSEDTFLVAPSDIKKINITFSATKQDIPDVYTGKILVRKGDIAKEINVIMQINPPKSLFSVKTKMLDKVVEKGKYVNVNITISNFGEYAGQELNLYYAVKDFDNNVLLFREEKIAVSRDVDVIRRLRMPGNAVPAMYALFARVSYRNESAFSSDFFQLIETEKPSLIRLYLLNKEVFIILLILLALFILVMLFRIYARRGARRREALSRYLGMSESKPGEAKS